MKPTFLCDNHKTLFINQPEQAIYSCAQTCEAARMLCQQERWQEALPYIGSAFETSEILLTTKAVTRASAIQWFLHTLAGLTLALKKLDNMDVCKNIYSTAIDRLEQELSANKTLSMPLTLQINRLKKELSSINYSGNKASLWADLPMHNKREAVLH